MHRLTLETANTIVAEALAHARAQDLGPLCVVVVDPDGHPLAAQCEDGAGMFNLAVARAKAWGSAANLTSSRALAERAAGNPNFLLSLAETAGGRFVVEPGGVLIRSLDGRVLGAAAACGAAPDSDEAACVQGIRGAGLLADLGQIAGARRPSAGS